jgi:hypothetical protein
MVEFRYWQSVKNAYWYWHFVDGYGYIRTIGGQYFKTADDCVQDIRDVYALLGGTKNIPIKHISDPNA